MANFWCLFSQRETGIALKGLTFPTGDLCHIEEGLRSAELVSVVQQGLNSNMQEGEGANGLKCRLYPCLYLIFDLESLRS